jgi:hypothetical protein
MKCVPWEEELLKSNFQQNFNGALSDLEKVTKQASNGNRLWIE